MQVDQGDVLSCTLLLLLRLLLGGYATATAGEVGVDDGGDDRVEVCGGVAEDVDGRGGGAGDMLGVEVAGLFEELEKAQLDGAVFGEHGGRKESTDLARCSRGDLHRGVCCAFAVMSLSGRIRGFSPPSPA